MTNDGRFVAIDARILKRETKNEKQIQKTFMKATFNKFFHENNQDCRCELLHSLV
jgi:hypothetical protein